jgi:uncharacterized membrane protein
MNIREFFRRYPTVFHLFLSLVASSAVGVLLIVVRSSFTEFLRYKYLIWNLFLAWIPLGIAFTFFVLQQRKKQNWLLVLLLLGSWLVFFPNTLYLVTDLIHLAPRDNIPFWYDILIFFSFCWNGVILGLTSLFLIHDIMRKRLGDLWSWTLIIFLMGLSNFGVYLGRFLRWNSWDVLFNPVSLFHDIVSQVIHVNDYPQAFLFTVIYSLFFILAYLQIWLIFNYIEHAEEKKKSLGRGRSAR